jgi:uncharacterized SAM-binding protein YcdF (DUF218 family)
MRRGLAADAEVYVLPTGSDLVIGFRISGDTVTVLSIFREEALRLGMPAEAILVESEATNTEQNIRLSRQVLADAGVAVQSVMLVCMPYMQRRAYATCRKVWPEVDVVCASAPITLDDYLKLNGEDLPMVDMMVGDLQRIIEYPERGFAIAQDVPTDVLDAYHRLVAAGYDSRLIPA